MTQTDSVLVVVTQGEIDRTHAAMRAAIRRAEEAEAQLAEARADHDRVYHDAEELAAEVMQLRAEVDQLRPAADLGDAYLASINEDADDNDIADLQDALEAAADRARAAKVTP